MNDSGNPNAKHPTDDEWQALLNSLASRERLGNPLWKAWRNAFWRAWRNHRLPKEFWLPLNELDLRTYGMPLSTKQKLVLKRIAEGQADPWLNLKKIERVKAEGPKLTKANERKWKELCESIAHYQ